MNPSPEAKQAAEKWWAGVKLEEVHKLTPEVTFATGYDAATAKLVKMEEALRKLDRFAQKSDELKARRVLAASLILSITQPALAPEEKISVPVPSLTSPAQPPSSSHTP